MSDQFAVVAGAQGADVGQQPAVADHHLDLASDLPRQGDRRVLVTLKRHQIGGIHADLRSRAGNLEDLADGLDPAGRRCRHRRIALVREIADFIQKFAQVRLLVHVSTHSKG